MLLLAAVYTICVAVVAVVVTHVQWDGERHVACDMCRCMYRVHVSSHV